MLHQKYANKWQKQGNRTYQTLPTLCTAITPFPANRPHCLCSEFSGFLFVLVGHTEWSLLLHNVIGDWMIPFAANATAVAKISNVFEWLGQPPKLPLPLGISSPCRRRNEPGHRQHAQRQRSCMWFWRYAQGQTDRHTDTYRRAHHNTSPPLPRANNNRLHSLQKWQKLQIRRHLTRTLISAPLSRRHLTTGSWPLSHAQCSSAIPCKSSSHIEFHRTQTFWSTHKTLLVQMTSKAQKRSNAIVHRPRFCQAALSSLSIRNAVIHYCNFCNSQTIL